jgi:hypothetical protein
MEAQAPAMSLGAIGNGVALLGDLIWLAADAVAEPLLHMSRTPFFWAIACCFLVAGILLLLEMRGPD